MIQFKNILVLNSLSGAAAEDPKFFEPHGTLQAVVDMPAPGFVRHILLGSEGLQVRHNDQLIVIPRQLLLKLAEQLNPAFCPPAPDVLAAQAAANAGLIPGN
jgi:hypothetical protein